MIRYHFDLYPRTNPAGARLVRFTNLQSAEYRGEANGTGAGRFSIRATDAEAAFIDPDGLQYVRVVRDDESTELVVGGFFLESGEYAALTETSTKLLTYGGAGTLSYLGRAVMDADSWIDDPFIGTDPQPDGTWPLHMAGTGNELGAILWRVLHELEEPGRHQDPVPLMTLGFTYLVDSNSAAWVRETGDFVAQVSDGVLSIIRRLMQLGLYVEMDPNTFEVNAYEPETHRRDRTGVAWAADVVRFQSPTDGTVATGNIKSDAKRALEAKVRRNALLVGSLDTWEWVTDLGIDVPWEGGYILDDEEGTALLKAGEAQLSARSEAGDVLRLRMKLGDDEANGAYLPFEHVQLDDLVTVHTGIGQWDYNEAEFPVAALTISLRPGGDWDAWAELGSTYLSMPERAFQAQPVGSHTHPPNPKLCAAATEGGAASCSMDTTTLTQIAMPNGDWEMGNGTNWTSGSPSAGDPEGVGGSWYFADNSAGAAGLTYDGWTALTFNSGQTYVMKVYVSSPNASIYFGEGAAGGPMSGDFVQADNVPAGLNCIEWTPSANRTGVRGAVSRPGSGALGFDNIRAYTGGTGSNPLHGTSGFASRCDHVHHVLSAGDPTVNDDADAGYPITTLWTNTVSGESFVSYDDAAGAADWQPFGAGADLSGINFLVGTASGDLSAEIAVGTTPGGELGNTWASPTVDATHAGSNHLQPVRKNSAGTVFERRRLNLIEGTNVTLTVADDAGNDEVDITIASTGGSGGTIEVEDEGTPLATAADTLDFVGAGVTATGAGTTKTITIPGGGGSAAGLVPTLLPHGIVAAASSSDATASIVRVVPFYLPGPMKLRSAMWSVQTGNSGTVQWGLFDASADATAATKIAGGSGALSSTGYQAIAAASAPVDVPAGAYLFMWKQPAANVPQLHYYSSQTGAPLGKYHLTFAWDDTPDLTTGWTTDANLMIIFLRGDMDGSGNQW